MAARKGPRKYIYDPVHGSISLTGATLELIGHPLLQRLWGIRQTGLAHLVFPGASHTRLEHSLGVLWVVREMSASLELPPDESGKLEVAGFLHDLGHTPFSHTLEPVLQEVSGVGHEEVTGRLILGQGPPSFQQVGEGISGYVPPTIPEVLERHGIDPKEIAGLLRARRPPRPPYRHEMLHGSIDADRLDYLQRDAHYTGVAHGVIDASRLLATLRREKGHLVFAEKARPAVEGFLVARSLMYSAVYYNKTVRVAEVMLQSGVERLPEFPKVEPLLALTDPELLNHLEGQDGGVSAEMSRRLRYRQLYKRALFLDWDEAKARRSLLDRWGKDPQSRRDAENDLADRMGVPHGSLLLDLAFTHRGAGWPGGPQHAEDPLWILMGGRVVDLASQRDAWHTILSRPITPWAVAVYTTPKLKDAVAKKGSRLFDALG